MSQTEEISATVRQFLDDAKQGVDGLGDPVPCNVAGLAAESVERWRATFDGDLALAAAEDPLHVTVDPVLFKRALGNVLSNGTRAAGDSGRVQVTVRRFETAEGERAVIEVDDSGPGFGNIPGRPRPGPGGGPPHDGGGGRLGGGRRGPARRRAGPPGPAGDPDPPAERRRRTDEDVPRRDLADAAGRASSRRAARTRRWRTSTTIFSTTTTSRIDASSEYEDELRARRVRRARRGPRNPGPSGLSLTGGHAFMTRLSAWSEPMAISGTPEQLAIGGTAEPANPFGLGRRRSRPRSLAHRSADNRSYFGLPKQQSLPTRRRAARPTTEASSVRRRTRLRTLAASGYFGLPLKDDAAPTEPPPAPHTRLYGPPADISAHPLPAGLRSAPHNAAPTPQAPSEITGRGAPGPVCYPGHAADVDRDKRCCTGPHRCRHACALRRAGAGHSGSGPSCRTADAGRGPRGVRSGRPDFRRTDPGHFRRPGR